MNGKNAKQVIQWQINVFIWKENLKLGEYLIEFICLKFFRILSVLKVQTLQK